MDAETLSHQEGSISPSLPHIFSTIKSESPDFWNPPAVTESYSTYAPLETLHALDSSPYSQYLTVVNNYPSYGGYSSYSNSPLPEDVTNLHSNVYRNDDVMLYQRDEGLGSSPSSLNSASPPTLNDSAAPIGVSSVQHYFDGQHERSSPGDSAYSEELPLPRLIMRHPQCVKCGISSSDIWWQDGTGHFLCGSCYQGRNQPLVHTRDDDYEMNDRKRKRPSTLNKKDNQSCTNCEAVSTSLWRRNLAGEVVCNACGLYEKLHKCARPISMKKDTIQTRKRKPRGSTGSKKKASDPSANLVVKKEMPSSPSYSLPTYSTLHYKDPVQLPNMTHLNESVLPPISSAAYYQGYKPEPINNAYHLMSPSVITMPLETSNMAASSPANT